MEQILLVEDQIELASLLQAFLRKKGFSLYHVTTGEKALAYLKHHKPNLVLLDIMLPGMDGFHVCEQVRLQGDIPILLMSARYEKQDKLLGFDLGADDYIEKPIDIDILCAKVTAIIKRQKKQLVQELRIQDIYIDLSSRQVYCKGACIDVNVKEYELLVLLMKHAGTTLHKEFLFHEIWGNDCFSENQTLTVHIKMLRSKIEDDPKHPKRIVTVWGIGYRYESV